LPESGRATTAPSHDLLYADVSKHIHVRELTDALAAARREVAEAGSEKAGAARVRLAEVAERAKKWGIEAKVPEGPIAAIPPTPAPQAVAPSHPAAPPETPATGVALITASSADVPWIGCPVLFIANPGERICGMQEIAGHVVRVQPDGRISMLVTADTSEPVLRDNLHRRGSPAGDGRVHEFNAWDFNPGFERERRRVRDLEEAVEKMVDEGNRDRESIRALQQAVADLTARMAPVESLEPANAKAPEKARKGPAAA
jgi:hypothetical protein